MPATEPDQPGSDRDRLQVAGGRGSRVALSVAGVLALVLVAGAGVWALGRGGEEPSPDTDPATPASTTSPGTAAPADPESLDLPTINPSDFPELPTDLPTELPSELMSQLTRMTQRPGRTELPQPPTDGGVPFPTAFPTDSEGWSSWFTDYLDQMAP